MRPLSVAILIFLLNSCSAYLSGHQMSTVKYILQHPQSSDELVFKTRECLAYHYIPWALKEFREFTYRNKKYVKNVSERDLRQYAILGLCNAAKSYDGSSSFFGFSRKHILGSLHQGLTLIEPLKPQTTKQRLQGQVKPTIVWGNTNEEWIYSLENHVKREKSALYKEKTELIKQIVDNLQPFEKRTFYYRYCEDSLREIRSVNNVCNLMVISSETYRKTMNRIFDVIRELLEEL